MSCTDATDPPAYAELQPPEDPGAAPAPNPARIQARRTHPPTPRPGWIPRLTGSTVTRSILSLRLPRQMLARATLSTRSKRVLRPRDRRHRNPRVWMRAPNRHSAELRSGADCGSGPPTSGVGRTLQPGLACLERCGRPVRHLQLEQDLGDVIAHSLLGQDQAPGNPQDCGILLRPGRGPRRHGERDRGTRAPTPTDRHHRSRTPRSAARRTHRRPHHHWPPRARPGRSRRRRRP